jgi:DNA repair protein RadC
MSHPHPSGDPSPSKQDIDITNVIQSSARAVGLELLDHIIVGSGGRAHSILAGGPINVP